MKRSSPFVLILGPSGVGKSTVIRFIEKKDPRVVSSILYTDRLPRPDDFGRVSVSKEEFTQMDTDGKFLIRVDVHGNRYGLLGETILKPLSEGKIVVQDWPESDVPIIKRKISNVYTIYLKPPSWDELKKRINMDGRDFDGRRVRNGIEEIEKLEKIDFKSENIDDVVVNYDLELTADLVLKLIYKRISSL